MHALLLLTQVFTRLPVHKTLDYRPLRFREAAYLAALHSALIALLPSAFAFFLSLARIPAPLNALLTLLLYVFLTGAFHLDGLADTADGLFSGRSKERILAIMKDPLIGSYGTCAIFFDLAIKSYVYFQLIDSFRFFYLPLLAAGGKTALLLAAFAGNQAKPDSTGNLWIQNVPLPAVAVSFFFCLALALGLNSILPAALSLIALFAATLLFVRRCKGTIGGLVGDNLGFCAEMGEILVGIFLISL